MMRRPASDRHINDKNLYNRQNIAILRLLTLCIVCFTPLSSHAIFDVIKTDKAQQGQDLCCKQMRCGATFTSEERDRKGSGGKSSPVASDSRSADSCYPAQVAAHGATALYAGAVSYSVQFLACTAACFSNATAAGPALSQICSIYSYASGALDLIITYAVTRNGQEVVDGLTGALMSTGVSVMTGGIGSASTSSAATTAASESGANGAEAGGKSTLDSASCLRAVVAGAMAFTKFKNASSAADEATRQYEMKNQVDNSSAEATKLTAYQQATNTASTDSNSGGTSNPQTSMTESSTKTAGVVAPSRDTSPATAVIENGMDDFLKKTTGVGTGQLMESYAQGVSPAQALTALAGSSLGANGIKLLQASEGLAAAANLTPEQASRIEPSNAPKIPDAAYVAARSGAANKGDDGMADMNSLMAGILESLNPAKDGARGPASGVSAVDLGRARAHFKATGVQYFPPGDETTIFDVLNRSYSRISRRMLGFESSPHFATPTEPSQPINGNPYLKRGP